tara:strand:+ start:290 stop:1912 length:1623 start_codon:yes stop_codon:yes gene_type:complete
MFANGGSVYLSPALRYMQQNPDVFNASTANARARGLTGINSQGQVERDAALHYAFHGQDEGRQYGGRTFLGGLLEPRLGDTFGLSPERKQELENERDNIANPPVELPTAPARGLAPLVPIDEGGGTGFAEGGIVSLAEGGEVYETSPVVQGYLQSNADVLNHSVRVAQSLGIPSGKDFQRAVENAAREHWNTYGKNEGRSISGYADDGASLMTADSERVIIRPQTEREGIFANPVSERMLAVAKLLQGTRNIYNDPEDLRGTAFFGTNPQGGFYEPEYQQTTSQIDELLNKISPALRNKVVTGGTPGQSDEDMVARDMNPVLRGLFQQRGTRNRSLFDNLGGQGELLRAYSQLGIEPPDLSGQRGDQMYGQGMVYDTIGGTPLSLAGEELTGIMNFANRDRSSIGADGTGGVSSIPLGGPTGTGYDSFSQMMADVPNMIQQLSVVPSVNPFSLANQLYNMYTGNFMKNPYDSSDATGTPRHLSVPSPMDFGGGAIGNAPPSREQLQAYDALQFGSPGYPGMQEGPDVGAFEGFGAGGGGE